MTRGPIGSRTSAALSCLNSIKGTCSACFQMVAILYDQGGYNLIVQCLQRPFLRTHRGGHLQFEARALSLDA